MAQSPTQNLTSLHTDIAPSWVSEPDGRGTWSILYSCTFTIGLCVYTAVHLNIPRIDEPRATPILKQIKWTIIAIIAPEIALFTAVSQFVAALRLKRELQFHAHSVRAPWFRCRSKATEVLVRRKYKVENGDIESQDITKDSNSLPRERSHTACPSDLHARASLHARDFDLTYCFYIVMGGIRVDVSDMHNRLTEVVLTADGVAQLARRGHFIEISDRTIKDKSKANVLAKGLVIIQVLWLFVQVVARHRAGLPISLLEAHTLIHVFSALCMYIAWWKKPKDISEASTVPTKAFKEDLAEMLVSSYNVIRIRWKEYNATDLRAYMRGDFAEIDLLDIIESSRDCQPEAVATRQSSSPSTDRDAQWRLEISTPPGIQVAKVIDEKQRLDCGIGVRTGYSDCPVLTYELSAKDIKRLDLASNCLNARQLRNNSIHNPNPAGNYLDSHFNNLSVDDIMRSLYSFVFISAIYGGIHYTLRLQHFPTAAEAFLWLISCWMLLGISAVMVLSAVTSMIIALALSGRRFQTVNSIDTALTWLRKEFKFAFSDPNQSRYGRPGRIKSKRATAPQRNLSNIRILMLIIPFGSLYYAVILGYAFARCYLVIESFISLRSVPIGVYVTPNWTNYFPHL